jgi:hypothetical protein
VDKRRTRIYAPGGGGVENENSGEVKKTGILDYSSPSPGRIDSREES